MKDLTKILYKTEKPFAFLHPISLAESRCLISHAASSKLSPLSKEQIPTITDGFSLAGPRPRRASYQWNTNTIVLPHTHRTKWIALHELAHAFCRHMYTKPQHHNINFIRILLSLVTEYISGDFAQAFIQQFKDNKNITNVPSITLSRILDTNI